MANYNVTITNGSGSERMKAGSYTVSVDATGYDATSLNPTSYTVSKSEGSQTFTVSANGTLTLTFNETGEAGGTPITSGSVIMTDSTGANEYGSAITISSTGAANFANVPYGTSEAPITLYFKQLTSDSSHYIDENIISVLMTSSSVTDYVENAPFSVQSFTLNDANYSGLPVNGTLNFSNSD